MIKDVLNRMIESGDITPKDIARGFSEQRLHPMAKVKKILSGKAEPKEGDIRIIAETLGMTIPELFAGEF